MQQREESRLPMGQRGETERDGIDQLREILFGAVIQDLERRIARADAQHASREDDLKHEARRRVEIIEAHMKQEIEVLSSRLEGEVVETAETLRSLAREQRESAAALDQRVAKLEEAVVNAQRQLRQEVLEQAKAFLDETQELRREFASTLEQRISLVERDLEREASDAGEDR